MNVALPVTSPVNENVLVLAKLTALPVTLPCIVPADILKLPVLSAVAVVVPSINWSLLSSHPINALSPVLPLSIRIPQSLPLLPAPLFNSNMLSLTVVLVVATVVVVPLTV